MINFLDKDGYYYYICNPDVIDETSKSTQILKYSIENTIFKFPKDKNESHVNYLYSIDFLIKRFSGKLNDNSNGMSHICKVLYRKKLELFDNEIFFKCKPNPNYVGY